MKKINEQQLREQLDEQSYKVLREAHTEPPFSGKYNTHFEDGVYHCKVCDSPLFTSESKFDSGCGWPSFDESEEGAITYKMDRSHGMQRIEILCTNCQSHLGHIFDDGPTKTGKRYCVNSVCLNFNSKSTENEKNN